MRRVEFGEYGGPEVLRVTDVPRPLPSEDEVLIEVAAVGVTLPVVRLTHGDGSGGGVPLPHAPGGEVVGRVAAVGPGVPGWRVGQRAAGLAFTGAYADFAAVRAAFLVPVPDEVSDAAAVAIVRSGQVALGALRAAALQPGERVLVTAAAGGVGHLAVQLAAALGANEVLGAVGAVGAAAKSEFLRGIGAHRVLRYDQPADQWGDPVDVVLDGTGGPVQAGALDLLAPFGRFVSYNAAGVMIDVNRLRMHARTVIGFAMAHFAARRPAVYERQQTELWDLHLRGALRPAVHDTLPLEQAARAHRIIEARENLGKIVLTPAT